MSRAEGGWNLPDTGEHSGEFDVSGQETMSSGLALPSPMAGLETDGSHRPHYLQPPISLGTVYSNEFVEDESMVPGLCEPRPAEPEQAAASLYLRLEGAGMMADSDLDESQGDVAAAGLALPSKGEPWNPARYRERTRGAIAGGLTLLVMLTVIATFITLWLDLATGEELRDILSLLFPPLIGLLGAATGFYYGRSDLEHRGRTGEGG